MLVLLSAATNAVALVLLRKATEAEEDRAKFSLRLVWLLVRRRPIWGAGIATIAVGFALQALALANGPLSVVQLVILMELPFTLLLAWPVLGGRLRAGEWSAIAAMTVGLVVVLFSLSPNGGNPFAPNLPTWLIGLALTTALVIVLLAVGQRSGPAARTALFGVAAGAASGLIAVLVKAVVVAFDGGFLAVIGTWQSWVLIAAAVGGFLLLQNALQAGRLAASQPGITLANPAVALVWGIGLFHEHTRTGWWLVGAGLGAALLASGAALLSRSPLLGAHQQGSEQDP
ncbi:MAG: DMT family transporter [Allobranchiibius sp.]